MAYLTINPANEQTLAQFPDHTDDQLEETIARAESVYQTDWSLKAFAERRTIVKKVAAIMRERREQLTKLVTLEMGKLLREAGARTRSRIAGCSVSRLGIGEFVNKKLIRVA
jgi:succinate-semialdehyde dehydrogenase / glutarate-semialdehyde dehydrogenase